MDYSAELMGSTPTELCLESESFDYLTKEEYLAGLNSVIRETVDRRTRWCYTNTACHTSFPKTDRRSTCSWICR